MDKIFRHFGVIQQELDISCDITKKLKSLMLFCKDFNNSPFWKRQSPWYYENYNCSDWGRIIRGEISRTVFEQIFDKDDSLRIDELIEEKVDDFLSYLENEDQLSIWKRLILLLSQGFDIWKHGNIDVHGEDNNLYSIDRYFKGEYSSLDKYYTHAEN